MIGTAEGERRLVLMKLNGCLFCIRLELCRRQEENTMGDPTPLLSMQTGTTVTKLTPSFNIIVSNGKYQHHKTANTEAKRWPTARTSSQTAATEE